MGRLYGVPAFEPRYAEITHTDFPKPSGVVGTYFKAIAARNGRRSVRT